MLLLGLITLAALLVGTGAITMALIEPIPVSWLYAHFKWRKPLAVLLFAAAFLAVVRIVMATGTASLEAYVLLTVAGVSVVLAFRLHQEHVFDAVDFPEMAEDPLVLPLKEEMQLAVISVEGITKAYPLDYVIHHHIVNDRFGERLVSLTYCAMCRTIIPFDVTGIGPLFVGSFKQANMIVADRGTRTWFQQASFESIIGPLHPCSLEMLPFQILSWSDVRKLKEMPQVARVTEKDLRRFELPVPGVWRKILASENTPGLAKGKRDSSFPARTRVIGVRDGVAGSSIVYLKDEVLKRGIVHHEEPGFCLVARGDTVNAFRSRLQGQELRLELDAAGTLRDADSNTLWDPRGAWISGALEQRLEPVAVSDEYWFSWKFFHPGSRVIRLG